MKNLHRLTYLATDDTVTSTTTNTNNGNIKKSPSSTPLSRSFQVESSQDFNWDDYLIVSTLTLTRTVIQNWQNFKKII